MKREHSNIILAGIVVGLVFAGLTVWLGSTALSPESFTSLIAFCKFLGDFFLRALRMLIVPLVLISVLHGVTSLGDIRKVGATGARTLVYFATTTGLAVLTGIILVTLIRPGVGVPVEGALAPEQIAKVQDQTVADIFLSFLHPNLFAAFAEGAMLPIIIFSLVFGAVLTTLGGKERPVLDVIAGMNEAIMKVVALVMWLAPIGIFGLVTAKFGQASQLPGGLASMLQGLAWYMLTVILGLTIHGFGTLFILSAWLGRRNPVKHFMAFAPALMTAWSTASSSATLPLTMECAEKRAGISPRSAGFVLPLGATINMDGTALYEAVAAIFIAQAYGVELSGTALVLIFITATLVSIGAAGIPEAGLFMMVIVLKAVNLPDAGIGLIIAVDWFLDRFRTTINVWGDCVGAAYVDRFVLKDAVPESVRTDGV